MIVPHTLARLGDLNGYKGYCVGVHQQERDKWMYIARERRTQSDKPGVTRAVNYARQANRQLLEVLKP